MLPPSEIETGCRRPSFSAIASVLFKQFATSYGDAVPTIGQATSVVLASLAIVGLSIFGGSIANGLISGAPQLGAGAAVGTGMAVPDARRSSSGSMTITAATARR